jgi:threonine/homoserine/homoserine lactone efflux protein
MPLAGPVSVLVIRRGLTGRARHGLALAVGAAIAETGWCSGALFGYGAVVSRWTWLRTAAGAAAGVLLIVLGLRFLLARGSAALTSGEPAALRRTWYAELLIGFSLVAGNLSVLFSWLAAIAALHAIGMELSRNADRWALVAGVPAGIVAWFGLALWLLGHVRARLNQTLVNRALRVLGAILCVVGAYALVMVAFRPRP